MIFITVGTANCQFNRLLKIIDELCDEKVIDNNEVYAQIGFCDYKPINYNYFDFISPEELKRYMKESSLIISHSGTGSVISALKINKKIIVMPRLSDYGEHVDNHQVELVNTFKKNGYILSANNKEEMKQCIDNIEKFIPNKFNSNTQNMENLLVDCIENNNNFA